MMRGASAEALEELGSQLGRGTLADAATTGDQLFAVADVLRTEVALRRVLTDAAVEGDAKAGLATSVFSASLAEQTLALLTDAVRRRWTSGHDLPDALEQLAVASTVRSAGAKGTAISDELFEVVQAVDVHADLRSALADPTRSIADRSALLTGLIESRTLPATQRLVQQAVVSTAGPFTTVLATYQKLVAAAQEESVAVVHTARELSDSELERITSALSRQYATTVHLHVVVEPALVGGLRIEIGDDVIDGSVSSRLDEARRRLAG